MKHQQIEYQHKRRTNPVIEVDYRNFIIVVHRFEEGDYYCPGYAFQIVKPDLKLFWEGGYISAGHESFDRGLSRMFWHIDYDLTDIDAEYFDDWAN
jgi:hypothetical protein